MAPPRVDANGNLVVDAGSTDPMDVLINRIRALRDTAASFEATGNLEAAGVYAAKLSEVLTAHKMTMSDVDLAFMEANDPVGTEYLTAARLNTHHRKTRVAWIEALAAFVAAANFCRILVIKRSSTIVLVGRKQDREVAAWLLAVLIREVEGAAHRGYCDITARLYPLGRHEECRGFKASFTNAAVLAIGNRLRDQRRAQEAASDARGNALVLRADTAVTRYIEAMNTGTGSALNGRAGYHGDGARAGYEFGRNVSLNTNALRPDGTATPALGAGH